jgi:carbon monoxide dehydrogenase subunit G
MNQVSSTITINAPADAIWQVISNFGAGGRYIARVVNCTVEGEGIGARRALTFADGSTTVERLDELDETARRLRYTLLADTPFGNCLATMTVRVVDPNQAALEWSATFQPVGLPPSEAAELMEGALAANCRALKQFFERER